MKTIRLRGTPYDRGTQYGEIAAEAIAHCIAAYEDWFGAFAGRSWTDVCAASNGYWEWVHANEPLAAAEMRGIADGSGRPLAEIVALNFRTELAYSASDLFGLCECTSLGVQATSSGDGHVYLAENWDWLDATLASTVLLDIEIESGLRIVTVTEAGMLAKFGANSAGVGLCVNLLGTNINRVGAGFHTLARKVLESTTLLEALWAITGAERGGSGNFMLGSKDGEVVDVEWNPNGYSVLHPHNGLLSHANHFVMPPRGATDRVQLLGNLSPGTFLRQDRADSLMRSAGKDGPGIGVAEIEGILRDHAGAPEGICRHGGPVGNSKVLGRTNVSVIIDLTEPKMHVAVGLPCEAAYETYELPWTYPVFTAI